ncbi:hypothetical protein NX722_19630 [Endozoicomonas gorgoniicola]|uniref:Uncharacterized protein n=1 Tax=Endozoicomonas gorgoniicola TaxID=1234144 RepID=A0ABT3N0P6_9GAMM|nr:hypothetical protein [Endozoicomonas gorgoniicola]MCW7554789.1 hypothetical protein [Endozoicomonas gorgoniicola]
MISHDPEELLAQYAEQQHQIAGLQEQLKAILGQALIRKQE